MNIEYTANDAPSNLKFKLIAESDAERPIPQQVYHDSSLQKMVRCGSEYDLLGLKGISCEEMLGVDRSGG